MVDGAGFGVEWEEVSFSLMEDRRRVRGRWWRKSIFMRRERGDGHSVHFFLPNIMSEGCLIAVKLFSRCLYHL